ARLLETFEHRVLGCREGIHRRLRRLRTGRRVADVLPPKVRKLRIGGPVDAGRGPLDARGRAVELDQAAELRRTLGEALVPDIGLTHEGETDMALLQGYRLGDDERKIEPGRLAAVRGGRLKKRSRAGVLVAELHAFLPVRAVRRRSHTPFR